MSSQATESTGAIEFAAWLEVNKQRIIKVGVTALVLGFGFWVYRQHLTSLENDANMALAQASMKADRRAGVTPSSEEYLKIAATYPGTAAAERAELLGAAGLFSEGKFADAQKRFDGFVALYPESSLLSVAALGSAACLDAQNDLDKALAAYKQVSVNYVNEPAGSQAKLAMAAIYESKNQLDEAIKIYNDLAPLSDDAPQRNQSSPFAREATQRRDLVFEQHPTLSPKATLTLPNMPGVSIDPKSLNLGPAKSPAPKAPAPTPAPAPAPKAAAPTETKK